MTKQKQETSNAERCDKKCEEDNKKNCKEQKSRWIRKKNLDKKTVHTGQEDVEHVARVNMSAVREITCAVAYQTQRERENGGQTRERTSDQKMLMRVTGSVYAIEANCEDRMQTIEPTTQGLSRQDKAGNQRACTSEKARKGAERPMTIRKN